jgi:hypothetical protein
MIFTIGVILFLAGWLCINLLGGRRTANRWDYLGAAMCVASLGFALTSILTLAWKYLP